MPSGQANSTLSVEIIAGCKKHWMKGVRRPTKEWFTRFFHKHGVNDHEVDRKKHIIKAIRKWWSSARCREKNRTLKKSLGRRKPAKPTKVYKNIPGLTDDLYFWYRKHVPGEI